MSGSTAPLQPAAPSGHEGGTQAVPQQTTATSGLQSGAQPGIHPKSLSTLVSTTVSETLSALSAHHVSTVRTGLISVPFTSSGGKTIRTIQ